ncbi:secretion system apparatus protein SsaU [Mycoavidus cysteinexigens]|uniref:Secretion system apparatus protein SsaU n=1 Tax=Mycoavidus cysteinexigens TaxID=1553431 RepID=A0A2Z6ETM1_9BURK|nr:EscU/YscU/HrcU family type III secretion system export apparatus switch protein [Mycoavidus cysteinexigens]BBE08757.1 secretion system apparatus protein SsaU [Mycoavidus cysteinexigens]GAM52528.1 type III secretion inner membrane protein [bacterium endosymbiont of Mortierella elongata FMR23-6]GLR01579.1 EscU/YscU/HrcU family type III secretion system export apparatus switch protein [Mycoavidus cysteinexigens]
MSEKTEKPTEKKLRDARKKGQVAKSADVTSGAQLAALLGYFTLEGPALMHGFEALINVSIDSILLDLNAALNQLLGVFAGLVIRFTLGIAALVIITTVLAIVLQIGPLLASEALNPSLKKINPLENLKQMCSLRSLFELSKSLFKVVLLSLIFFYLIRQYAPSLQFLPLQAVTSGLLVSTRLLYIMWSTLVGFYVLFGLADFAFQRYTMTKQLMMSIEDIKQEFKNSEGNPEIKQKRKETHREVQSGSLAANVAKSTAVVRNPTHLAVCLYYRPGETPLPQVLEIGHDEFALHIVALAEKAGIPVVENIPLARALAAQTEVGRAISPHLFEPVAHILRLAMKLKYDHEPT